MASAKLATLVIRTLAKPISNQIKQQAKEHERFRNMCISIAQNTYRAEVKLRTNLLGEPAKTIRPLSEHKAIENGANTLAEGFLFAVAAGLIIGETWRSSRSQAKRRDVVDDQIEDLSDRVRDLSTTVAQVQSQLDERWAEEKERNDELSRILERVVEIGLRGGWAEFEETPLKLPKIELARRPPHDPSSSSNSRPESQTQPPPNQAE